MSGDIQIGQKVRIGVACARASSASRSAWYPPFTRSFARASLSLRRSSRMCDVNVRFTNSDRRPVSGMIWAAATLTHRGRPGTGFASSSLISAIEPGFGLAGCVARKTPPAVNDGAEALVTRA